MLKHWEPLPLFLRHPGVPLDNNRCERALKKVILHRKNAYFYKTAHGARVRDMFMSLIHTCELNNVMPGIPFPTVGSVGLGSPPTSGTMVC